MAILTLKNSSLANGNLELKPGANRIGRADGNDFTISDPSVSSRHCEIILDGETLLVRDLGSTNGTYIQGQPVTESPLRPGQSLRLGSVELDYQSPVANRNVEGPAGGAISIPVPRTVAVTITAPSGKQAGAPIHISAPVRIGATGTPIAVAHAPNQTEPDVSSPVEKPCSNHVAVTALHVCNKCGRQLCGQCVSQQKVGGKAVLFCRGCGGQAKPIGEAARSGPAKPATFGESFMGAFRYPFKGNGLIFLITGTIFFGFLDALASAQRTVMIVTSGTIMVRVISYGYLFAYMQKIIVSSSAGEDEPPGWPDVSDMWSDVIQPFFGLLFTYLACFGPGYLASWYLGGLPVMFLFGLGAIFFPMALLSVAMADSVSALNPVVIVSSILKVVKPYILVCIVFGILMVIKTMLPGFLKLLNIPILPFIIVSFVSMLLVTIEMRLLGLLYFTNKERLGWF